MFVVPATHKIQSQVPILDHLIESFRGFCFLSLSLSFLNAVLSRRHRRHESHEVNKVLSNQSNFAAWARVTDDSDSIMLAKNIGEFLG